MIEGIATIFAILGVIFLLVLIFVPLIWAVFMIGDYFGLPFWIKIAFLVILIYIILG